MSFSIEQLQQDLVVLNARKDHAMQQFHQLLGAASIIEQMIQKLLNPTAAEPVENAEPQKENEDGEVVEQGTEQAA